MKKPLSKYGWHFWDKEVLIYRINLYWYQIDLNREANTYLSLRFWMRIPGCGVFICTGGKDIG